MEINLQSFLVLSLLLHHDCLYLLNGFVFPRFVSSSKMAIPENLDSGRMVWKLGLWTPRRLDSGRLDAQTLGTWTLDDQILGNWTLGLQTLGHQTPGQLDSGRLDASTLDSQTLDAWKLELWTPGSLDSGCLDNRLTFENYTLTNKEILKLEALISSHWNLTNLTALQQMDDCSCCGKVSSKPFKEGLTATTP